MVIFHLQLALPELVEWLWEPEAAKIEPNNGDYLNQAVDKGDLHANTQHEDFLYECESNREHHCLAAGLEGAVRLCQGGLSLVCKVTFLLQYKKRHHDTVDERPGDHRGDREDGGSDDAG